MANHPRYRGYIISVLTQVTQYISELLEKIFFEFVFQIANLDFSPVVQNEKQNPPPPEVVKKIKEHEKTEKKKV